MKSFLAAQQSAWDDVWDRFRSNGPGSSLENTRAVREALPSILERHNVHSILDAPCGNWEWMRHVDLRRADYTGWDIHPAVLAQARRRAAGRDCRFAEVNLLTVHTVPRVDLILCRDFFLHLPTEHIAAVMAKFVASGSGLLLTTNWPTATNVRDCPLDGGDDDRPGYFCQPVNLDALGLEDKLESFPEGGGQEMALYRLASCL